MLYQLQHLATPLIFSLYFTSPSHSSLSFLPTYTYISLFNCRRPRIRYRLWFDTYLVVKFCVFWVRKRQFYREEMNCRGSNFWQGIKSSRSQHFLHSKRQRKVIFYQVPRMQTMNAGQQTDRQTVKKEYNSIGRFFRQLGHEQNMTQEMGS